MEVWYGCAHELAKIYKLTHFCRAHVFYIAFIAPTFLRSDFYPALFMI